MAPRPRAHDLGDLNSAVAATLNGERVAVGLTYEQLAERSGIPLRSLKRYISKTHDRLITVDALGRLAVALDLPIVEIMRRAEQRRTPSPHTPRAEKVPQTGRPAKRAEGAG